MLPVILSILILHRLPRILAEDPAVFSVGSSLSLSCPFMVNHWLISQHVNRSSLVVTWSVQLNQSYCLGCFESSTQQSTCREDIVISPDLSTVEVKHLMITDAGRYTCVYDHNHIAVPWRHVTIVDDASKQLTVMVNGTPMHSDQDSFAVQLGTLLFLTCSANFSGFIEPSMELILRRENGSERVLASRSKNVGTVFNVLEEVNVSAHYAVAGGDSHFEIFCKLQTSPSNMAPNAVFIVNDNKSSETTSSSNSTITANYPTTTTQSTDQLESRNPELVQTGGKQPEKFAAENSIKDATGFKIGLPLAIAIACLLALSIGLAVYFTRRRNRTKYSDINASSMKGSTQTHSQPSLFGSTLAEVMAMQRERMPNRMRRVPWIQVDLSQEILRLGGENMEGIFRVPADVVKAREVKRQYESWNTPDAGCRKGSSYLNAAVSVFKKWFQELREPLIPREFHSRCFEACNDPAAACDIVREFPEINRLVLQLLVWLLRTLNTETSKMDAKNFAIVMSPNVFASYDTGTIDYFQTLISHLDVSDVNEEKNEILSLVSEERSKIENEAVDDEEDNESDSWEVVEVVELSSNE